MLRIAAPDDCERDLGCISHASQGGVTVGYGIGAVVASGLVPPKQRSRAISLMFAGLGA